VEAKRRARGGAEMEANLWSAWLDPRVLSTDQEIILCAILGEPLI